MQAPRAVTVAYCHGTRVLEYSRVPGKPLADRGAYCFGTPFTKHTHKFLSGGTGIIPRLELPHPQTYRQFTLVEVIQQANHLVNASGISFDAVSTRTNARE